MTLDIVTFGCRLNAYESAVMRGLAERDDGRERVIVNTCAVTAEAERQARQAIRKLRRERPGAEIVVTGCAAQIDPTRFSAMPEVDRVVGNAEKLTAEAWRDGSERVLVGDIAQVRETAAHLAEGFSDRARAFLEVQQGCDHRCTFCVIPQGRGPSRSVPVGKVVDTARALAERGYNEIVLTGVDLTAYGADLPGQPRLGSLVRRLLRLVPELPRLRLSSLDVAEIDDDLWRAIAEEPRLMPHLHLSLQSGSDMILKRMRRRHSRADSVAFAARARALRPGLVLGADLIAGFPTEDEAMAAETLALVEDCDLTFVHVFPYSARQGTPATRMPQVPAPRRKERAAALRRAGDAALARHLAARIGSRDRALVERDGLARTEGYAPALVPAGVAPGSVLPVRLTGHDGRRFHALPLAA